MNRVGYPVFREEGLVHAILEMMKKEDTLEVSIRRNQLKGLRI